MIMIIAVLSGENIFHTSNDKRDQILVAHSKFVSKHGDHLTILNAFREFLNAENPKMWCFKHFLNYRNLMYANEVRKQLMEICKRCNLEESSCGSDFDQVCSSFFTHISTFPLNFNGMLLLRAFVSCFLRREF